MTGNFNAGEYAFFFYKEMLAPHGVWAYGREGSVVAIANVLGKRQVDKGVDKFLWGLHD